MSSRKIMSIVGLSLVILLIISLFMPALEPYRRDTMSLWEYFEQSDQKLHILLLVELIITTFLLTLQICGVLKDTKLAMIPVGFYATWNLNFFLVAIENDFDVFAFGYYFSLIISIAAVVVLAVGGLLSNERKPKKYNYGQPIGYDPKTGEPIYN